MAWLRWDLIQRALSQADGPVLEVGCGQGAMGARLARRFTYTGVEPDPASAAVARSRVADVATAQVVQRPLDEEGTGEYGLVCAFEVLEHLEDDAAALELWHSHVAPGGRLVLSVPAWQHRFGPTDEHVGHYRRYDPDVLASRLRSAGFEISSMHLYGFPLGYALEGVRNRITGRRSSPASTSHEVRSRGSGRFLQPRGWMGRIPWVVTLPFRLLQRLFVGSSMGTGIVAVGIRPEPRA